MRNICVQSERKSRSLLINVGGARCHVTSKSSRRVNLNRGIIRALKKHSGFYGYWEFWKFCQSLSPITQCFLYKTKMSFWCFISWKLTMLARTSLSHFLITLMLWSVFFPVFFLKINDLLIKLICLYKHFFFRVLFIF